MEIAAAGQRLKLVIRAAMSGCSFGDRGGGELLQLWGSRRAASSYSCQLGIGAA
jgi:hypothetical protein